MKTLFLLRHVKSDWDDPWVEDFDRPLALRGRKAAPRMARYMAAKGLVPDLVLCSSARRTRETWALTAAQWDAPPPVRFRKGIYEAAATSLLALIRKTPAEWSRLMVIGHNPGMENLAHLLTGGGKTKAIKRMMEKFPTGALAELRFDAETWPEIQEETGELRRFKRPRDLD
tara:strand:- start:6 stop:521 length:516 start_codon:yes stop_codon:yes gene_type:complete